MGLTTQQKNFVMQNRNLVTEIVDKMRIKKCWRDDAISDGTLALMQCVLVEGQGDDFENKVEEYIVKAISKYPKRKSTKIVIDITVN